MIEDRRHPRRTFDPSLVQSFLKGRNLESVELLPFGKSNTNYKLVLRDGEQCVLRRLASSNAPRERYLLRLVRDIVPVPEVLDSGEDWLLLSFCEGKHLAEIPERTHLAAAVLAKIASIEFPSEGWIGADGTISPFDFGNEDGFVPTMLEHEDIRHWLDEDAVTALSRILRREREEAVSDALRDRSCLCHGDFNPTNILVHDGRIAAILDWEFAHSGTVYMDLGNLLRHTPHKFHEQIRSGFEASGMELPDDWKKRAEFIDLSSHLEFLTSQRSDEFKQQCVKWIHDFIMQYRGS